jgi:dTDP-4-dehydrorhamnose reductase
MTGRLLVFGGGGFVGGNLCTLALRQGWEVHVADAKVRDAIPGASWHAVDITHADGVRDLVRDVRPDAVVDLAAVADVDRAEREKELARSVNVEAARVIAAAAESAGARCIYFSSDAVFAGTSEVYAEDDAPQPVNWYGRTKADGEQAVRGACPGAVIVRISLVLGFPVTDGNSFLAGLEQKLAAGATVPCPTEEIRTPIDVLTLCACVLELCGRAGVVGPAGAAGFQGAIHLGATNSVDRFTLTRAAAALMGASPALVVAQEPGQPQAGRAARHKRGVISVDKAKGLLATPLLDWERTLRKAFDDRPK